MWNTTSCRRIGIVFGVLGAFAMVSPGSQAFAADEAPVVLYESDHLGYGEVRGGGPPAFGTDVAIDGPNLMVADDSFEDEDTVASFRRQPDGSWGDRLEVEDGVSADIEGQRALIGADYACWDDQTPEKCGDGYGYGSLGYFEQSGDGTWLRIGEYMRPAARDLYRFGDNVDLSGSVAVATAQHWEVEKAVLIFEQRNGAWEQVYDIRFETRVGSLALDGDTLLVGTPYEGAAGIVHMYRLNARGNWRPRGTFAPADVGPEANFGASVALDGNRALVGAPGENAAYVFERGTSTGVWRERARLEAEPAPAAWRFGASVALDGDIALVGRPGWYRDTEAGGGSVHVFARESRSDWPRRAILAASDGTSGSAFGSSLAIDGMNVVVGAPGHELIDSGYYWDQVGAAYYFDLSVLFDDVRFVDIDVKPGSDDNLLDPDDDGSIWVAVLSAMDFDALQVDPDSVTFGPGAARPFRDRVADTNADGYPDLKLRFAIPEIGLSCDATTLQLTGTTYDGQAIFGQETVDVVGCDEIVVKVKPLNADRGVVDLIEPSFYVFVLSEPGFDPATVDVANFRIAEFGGSPRGYNYWDRNGDGVPDLRLRYKTKDVRLDCGDHDISVDVDIVDEGGAYIGSRNGTLRITVAGC